jgi:hypothetical protein
MEEALEWRVGFMAADDMTGNDVHCVWGTTFLRKIIDQKLEGESKIHKQAIVFGDV